MTEVEKMRSSQLADMSAPELQERFEHAKKLLAVMRGLSTYDDGYRELLEELVPGIPETSVICPPFHCDHGDGIRLGEHVFVNSFISISNSFSIRYQPPIPFFLIGSFFLLPVFP